MRGITGKRISAVAFSALLVALFALGGCGSAQPASSVASASSSASAASAASSSSAGEAVASDLAIGEKTTGAESIVLANETGSAISGLAIAPAGSDAEPVALMAGGQRWADGEVADVYFEPQGSGSYDIQVTIGDAVHVLHGFDADLIASAEIRLSGDVAYVAYEQFGNETSTLDAERAIADEERAAAEAEAAAAAEAEAAAAAEAEAAAAAQQPAPAATSAPAQSDDQCIDGGVVLR